MTRAIELAKECGIDLYFTDLSALEAFYKAAHREGQTAYEYRDKQLAAKDAVIAKLQELEADWWFVGHNESFHEAFRKIINDDTALQDALKQARKDALLAAADSLRIESDTLGWHENHCKKWLRRMASEGEQE